ncbi:hypothetical protein [Chitinophaga sp. 22620]|uniref:hypothetical protein n=1 Tax=Chitinophaga sp. 22620 TaxID=3453952 RepID=UPI003F866099
MRYLFLLLCLPLCTKAQSPFERKYAEGETYRYRMVTDYHQNGQWKSTTTAICELKVVKDSAGIPYDEIRWLSQRTISAKDTTDGSAEALAVKPYRISLHPSGSLHIPPIGQPGMTGAITDFNTFFVAVSHQSGAGKLLKKGDSINKASPVTGDFSNGKTILKGQDCLQIIAQMTASNARSVEIKTSFLPPAQTCLQYFADDLAVPVAGDTVNNFQMVMPAGPGQYIVQAGREYFIIHSTVRKKDGKISSAVMVNDLKLRMKINCGENYTGCQREMPWNIYRQVRLELQ